MRRRRHSGFTLIELMVTLVVGAVLVGLAAPSFREMMIKSRVRGATDDIVNLFNTARATAIKLERDVNVSIQGSTTWCAGAVSADVPTVGEPVQSASACDCSSTVCSLDSRTALVSSANYADVSISNIANAVLFSKGGLVFNSKLGAIDIGSAPATNVAIVQVSSGKFSTRVFLYPLGQTYVCTPSGSPFISGYPSC